MDALLTQRHFAMKIIAAGGYYMILVKANQPQLLEDIQTYFKPVNRPIPPFNIIESLDVGHGRIEQRQLQSSPALNNYLDCPGIQPVFKLKRTIFNKKKVNDPE